jgi:hypothetical protein
MMQTGHCSGSQGRSGPFRFHAEFDLRFAVADTKQLLAKCRGAYNGKNVHGIG